jgi:hypothetical protein
MRRAFTSVCALAFAVGISDRVHSGQATRPDAQQPPPAQKPPASEKRTEPTSMTDAAPRLPPFAGTLVNFDKHGDRTVACVDRSTAPVRPGAPAPPKPTTAPGVPRQTRIWIIQREVMQELMTTSGMCDPVWRPDGAAFAASGPRGVFLFTSPSFEARPLFVPAPEPGASPPSVPAQGASSSGPPTQATPAADGPMFSGPRWSPGGARLAFLVKQGDSSIVRVVDATSGKVLFTSEPAVSTFLWGSDEKTITVDKRRVSLP